MPQLFEIGSVRVIRSELRVGWPDRFRCPGCGEAKAWPVGRLWQCAACGRQTSVTAGTILQDTRTPLTVWFRAMWVVTGRKAGTSALTLHQLLGLGSYQTAWTWAHKLRRAMVRPGRERLAGHVEVDETFVGAVEAGAVGRGAVKKVLIVVAVEYQGRKIGRIRLRRVPDGSAQPANVHRRRGRTRQPGAHRWLAGVRPGPSAWLPASHHVPQRPSRTGARPVAAGAPSVLI